MSAVDVRQVLLDQSDSTARLHRDQLAQQDIFTGALPDPETIQGALRLIEIDGIDLNACGGTHVSCTSQLQVLKVLGWEKKKGCARLYFMVGGRVLAYCAAALTREAELNKVLSCAANEHVEQARSLQSLRQTGSKAQQALVRELAVLQGKELADKSQSQGGVGLFVRPGADHQYLSLVASTVLEIHPQAMLLLLAPEPAGDGPHPFLIAGNPSLVATVSREITTILKGKGGGKPGRFQGKAAVCCDSNISKAFHYIKVNAAVS